jgi:hypothetical protein
MRFHYNRLVPNYDKYWQGDSDAVSSIDRYEALRGLQAAEMNA